VKDLLRYFFHLLYHQLAFTYDRVAALVSFNRWKGWVLSVVPFLEGTRILELGHGPGHLQRILLSRGLVVVGIDASAQMGRLARRNLARRTSRSSPPRIGYTQTNLLRGVSQALPFAAGTFDTIVATFPTEYITDPATLAEVMRCLTETGKLVVLPVALPKNPALDWLFKVTHQRPAEALEVIQTRLSEPFVSAGLATEIKTVDTRSGVLLIVLATNQPVGTPEAGL
jgi:ubiquinone/menaquinone biosynthesis C-methylase UbiE